MRDKNIGKCPNKVGNPPLKQPSRCFNRESFPATSCFCSTSFLSFSTRRYLESSEWAGPSCPREQKAKYATITRQWCRRPLPWKQRINQRRTQANIFLTFHLPLPVFPTAPPHRHLRPAPPTCWSASRTPACTSAHHHGTGVGFPP